MKILLVFACVAATVFVLAPVSRGGAAAAAPLPTPTPAVIIIGEPS